MNLIKNSVMLSMDLITGLISNRLIVQERSSTRKILVIDLGTQDIVNTAFASIITLLTACIVLSMKRQSSDQEAAEIAHITTPTQRNLCD